MWYRQCVVARENENEYVTFRRTRPVECAKILHVYVKKNNQRFHTDAVSQTAKKNIGNFQGFIHHVSTHHCRNFQQQKLKF